MKLSVCLLIKDENDYLQEWLDHHRKIGFSSFYIYDNHSVIPVSETLKNDKDCFVKIWDDQGVHTQVEAYNDCCLAHPCDDFTLFIDTDEFLMINIQYQTIEEALHDIKFTHGNFAALGLYWRIYGKTEPYFQTRQPISSYTQYLEYTHIKTLARPKSVTRFVNPHSALICGNYISESGRKITGPYSDFHSSNFIWIKHTFTRSVSEFKEKLSRGSGDKVNIQWTMDHYRKFNDECIFTD
ncbi:MAG: glycosyltransferase family 2 protein [Prolixibacteraceae bacterium]